MEDVVSANLKEKSQRSEEDDEFYEQIEAPKFVDFTALERSRPDDSSWFCVRIGCDQKHEQIDPDALYKSFVLRVMAARSPNVRLQKALSRQASSVLDKCPRSAPPKSAKSRIPRFSVLTSIPQKIGENNVKVSLFSKLKSIPCEGKVVQSSVTSKALTTPTRKKCLSNADLFHTTQNLKVKTALSKNRVIAKALPFLTPKNSKVTSFNCQDGSTLNICCEMKKLEISSQATKAPRHFCKSSSCAACNLNHKQPASRSRKSQQHARKLNKNRIEVPSKYLKKISKPNVQRCHNSDPQEGADADSSDMEIDGKSRNGSLEACPASNGHEKNLKDASSMISLLPSSKESSTSDNSLPNSENDSKENHQFKVSNLVVGGESKTMENTEKENDATDNTSVGFTSKSEEFPPSSGEYCTSDNSLSHSEEILPNNNPIFLTSGTSESADEDNNKESADKENTIEETTIEVFNVKEELIPSLESSDAVVDTESMEFADKENALASNRKRDMNLNIHPSANGVVDVTEPMEIADKENALASNGNRDMNINIHHSARKTWQHRECENQRVCEVPDRILKENFAAPAATARQGVRLKKSKPTNPKPFRLRTDERGILKEAKLERRMHLLDPLKEATPISNEMLPKRQPSRNEMQQNKNSNGQESIPNESNMAIQKAKKQQNRPANLKFARYMEPKKESRTPQREKSEDGKEKVTQKMQRSSKSPASQEQLITPQRGVALQGRLAVIREKSTISRNNAAPSKKTTYPRSATGTTTVSRSPSRRKRPLTVPKEPNFHSINVPKSCTKTPTNATS